MASNILSSIYKQGETVVKELQGMNSALLDMQKRDKQEYSGDAKFRKYERERDKRQDQDRHKFQKKIDKQIQDTATDVKKGDANKSLSSGLAVALAAAVAAIVSKNKKKKTNEEQPPKSTGGGGRSMFIPTRPDAEDNKPVTTAAKDLNPKPPQTVKFNGGSDSLEQRVSFIEKALMADLETPTRKGFQSGGFTGAVPNMGQPTTGDHFYTGVQPGSYILNRNAVKGMGFQSGGTVPVALEQGEIALPPGSYDPAVMDHINYNMFPRFQKGGNVDPPPRKGDGAESEPILIDQKSFKNVRGYRKGGKIFLHWTGSSRNANFPKSYHAVIQSDGSAIKNRDYNSFGGGHTWGRNSQGIGLSIASMGGYGVSENNFGKYAPTQTQYTGLAKLTAKIAKSWGWSVGDINANNIPTHAEIARTDGYGPGSGDPQTKWDFWMLKQGGAKWSGGPDLRSMIKKQMRGGSSSTEQEVKEQDKTSQENSSPIKPVEAKPMGRGPVGGGVTMGSASGDGGGPDVTSSESSGTQSFWSGFGAFGSIMKEAFGAVSESLGLSSIGLSLGDLLFPGLGGFGGGGGGGFDPTDTFIGPESSPTMGEQRPSDARPGPLRPRRSPGGVPRPESSTLSPERRSRQPQGGPNRGERSTPVTGASTSANRKAMLDTIAFAEGTYRYPSNGYKTMFTGKQFQAPPWRHPRRINYGGGHASDAAGRYQFLSTTWDGHKLPDFSPANQDKAALQEIKWKGGLGDVDAGRWSQAFTKSRKVWASFPGAGYNQPEKSMKSLVNYANKRAKKYSGKQSGGAVGNMSGRNGPGLVNFMEQNEIQNMRMAANDSAPMVIGGGGGGGGQEEGGGIVAHTNRNNVPTHDLPIRDSCPLSIYYRFEPSFNPNGMGAR